MNPEDEKNTIESIYKSLIQEELARPEVQEEKQAFIEKHFAPEPAPLFGLRPAVFVPAFAMIIVAMLFGYPFVQKQVQKEPIPAKIMAESTSTQVTSSVEPKILTPEVGKPTEVEEVSSDVGSVMVYQRMHQEVPITIVWVFTPQGM